jgi:hypothetical protein
MSVRGGSANPLGHDPDEQGYLLKELESAAKKLVDLHKRFRTYLSPSICCQVLTRTKAASRFQRTRAARLPNSLQIARRSEMQRFSIVRFETLCGLKPEGEAW